MKGPGRGRRLGTDDARPTGCRRCCIRHCVSPLCFGRVLEWMWRSVRRTQGGGLSDPLCATVSSLLERDLGRSYFDVDR